MFELPALAPGADGSRGWLGRRLSHPNVDALHAALLPDEEPEVGVRTTSGQVVVVTNLRLLVAADGVVQSQIPQSHITAIEVRVHPFGAELRLVSRRFSPIVLSVPQDQIGPALDALEAIHLGMDTRPLQ